MIKKWMRTHKNSITNKMVFAVVTYSILLANNLVNRQDGIWNAATYQAANWELSIGRWALRYVDFLQFGVKINPLTSLISLLLFVIGTELAVEIFEIKLESKWNYIGSFLFLGNMVICDVLSYSFTSVGYALAFALSILAVKYMVRSFGG